MPVNPAQLKSLVDQHSSGPSASSLGMAPPDVGADPDDDMDEDEPSSKDPAARGTELIEEWGEFGDAIKESAGDIMELATDAGGGLMLKEPDEDSIKELEKGVDGMPDDLSMGFAKYVSKLSPEDLHALATALASEAGSDADEKLLEAYLTCAGKYAGEEIDVDEDFNEDEEDDDEDEEEDDDAPPADKAKGPPAPPPPAAE